MTAPMRSPFESTVQRAALAHPAVAAASISRALSTGPERGGVAALGLAWALASCGAAPAGPAPETAGATTAPLSVQPWDRRAAARDGAGAAAQIAAQITAGGGRPVWLQDDDLHVVVGPMTATLDPVSRAPGGLFSAAAAAADSPGPADVVLNGMTYSFDPSAHQAGGRADTRGGAHGRALRGGAVLGGQRLRPETGRGHLRWAPEGPALAWRIGPGDLEDGTGISGGMPILTGGALIGAPGGAPHPDTDRLLRAPAGVGWPVVGLDLDRRLVWVVATAWGRPPARGTTLDDLRRLLAAVGVDEALAFDGADSTALFIDGQAVIAPGLVKDRSAPYGVHIRWAPASGAAQAPLGR